MATKFVALRSFTYAGQVRDLGEVFPGSGFHDLKMVEIGYLREHEASGDEVVDADGREYLSAAVRDSALAARARRDAEAAEVEAIKARNEAAFTLNERAVAEERAVHRGRAWQCWSDVETGGCGTVVDASGILQHIASHGEPARGKLKARHEAMHLAYRESIGATT